MDIEKKALELVGRLRQPNECERWLFSVPFEAADMLQSLAAQLAEARAALEKIALGLSIELDQEDGPVEVWLDAEELSDIARAALEQGEVA